MEQPIADVHDGIFDIRTASERLAETRDGLGEPLLGDLWKSGEISVMFAEPGSGKSIFGVQIAESVARGRKLGPFDCGNGRRKVLYLDLGSSPGHFRARYEPEPSSGKASTYRFSPNLMHLRPVEREIALADIEPMINQTGARVLIIDSLVHLMRSPTSSKEAAAVMRELRRLRRVCGLSILVIADVTRMTPMRRGIEASDMPFAGMLAIFADNVFTIGRIAADPAGRYIKHIKAGATPLVFGAAHVPWFRITKRAGFTHFAFRSFAREMALRGGDEDRGQWSLVRRIRELNEAGLSVRKIAAELKMSRSTVQRYIELSRDDVFAPPPKPDPYVETLSKPPSDDKSWLSEYNDAIAEADSRKLAAVTERERSILTREIYLLHLAKANACRAFAETGIESRLEETISRMPEFIEFRYECLGGEIDPVGDKAGPGQPDTHDGIPPPQTTLERGVDPNGREIFVERRDPYNGQIMIWYQPKTNRGVPTGTYTRWMRQGFSIFGKEVAELPSGR